MAPPAAELETEPESDLTEEAIAIAIAMALLMGRREQAMQDDVSSANDRLMRAEVDALQAEINAQSEEPWSSAKEAIIMALIAAALVRIVAATLEHMAEALGLVSLESRNSAAVYLTTLDRAILGETLDLDFNTVEWWEKTNGKISRNRRKLYTQAWQRYGAAVVLEIRDAIKKQVELGESWDVAKAKIGATTRKTISTNQWRIDRILATEVSAAWNHTLLEAMIAEDTADEPMLKKLQATFDIKTGRDSKLLHLQTRPVDEPFWDAVNGIHYMAPPNRPNDREVMLPWRASYGDEISDDRLQKAAKEAAGLRTRQANRDDPRRPTRASRDRQLHKLRTERRLILEELRRTGARLAELRQDPGADPIVLFELTNRRTLLRRKAEEQSLAIETLKAK